MPTLIAESGVEERRISFIPGRSLRQILDTTDVRARTGCRGMGACGLCRVRVREGEVGKPTLNERIHLNEEELAQGIRLACQVIAANDLRIEILSPTRGNSWRSLEHGANRIPDPPLSGWYREVQTPCGAAVDLGTTHISISLFDLTSGRWLAGRHGRNPQADSGSDVVARLMAASESPARAGVLSTQVIEAIGGALCDAATGDGIDLGSIVRMTLVGNTTMLALLSGRNHRLLTQPSNWSKQIDCAPRETGSWAISWGIHPRARIVVLPPLAGFVGSDLTAGVLSTELVESEPGALFVDFGTNSEIALWDGEILWVTSTAGGPAFEGSGIGCGIPAEPGAIYRVVARNGCFDLGVIGNVEPRGLCGSGLVDLIARLLDSGRLTDVGRFTPGVPPDGFELVAGERTIVLSKRDVDVFQRAKAAIGVGIRALLTEAGMGPENIRRICVGGTFGRFLDVANAQRIGLLPAVSPRAVELHGNTALAGCEEALLSSTAVERLHRLMARTRLINLSQTPAFDELFLEHLYLRAFRGE